MRRRYITALLMLVMLCALLPTTALADTASSVIVGGKTMDGTTNIYATTNSSTGEVTLGGNESSYNIKFQNGVLTLKDATIAGATAPYNGGSPKDCGIYAAGELKLVLIGTNIVNSSSGANVRSGIYVYYLGGNNGSLTVEGNGTLRVRAAEGGGHVHYGIHVAGSLTVNSGTITAEGRNANGNTYGVQTTTDLILNGGSLTATGGNVTGTNNWSYGVMANGKVTINGGTLNAIGGTGGSCSFGVGAGVGNGISINASSDGQVKVSAQTADATNGDSRSAFNQAPVISDDVYYTWRINKNDPTLTPSTTTRYSRESSQRFTELTLGQIVAAPTISPAAGEYTSAQSVTLACTTAGASIRYTSDGTIPTEGSPVYSAAIPVSSTTTIKARAFKSGMTPSATAEGEYTFPCDVTVASGTGNGSYFTGATVTITADTPAEGMQFKEWMITPAVNFTEGSASTATAKFTMPSSAVTATATYEDIPITTYTITYDPNGGSGSMPDNAATADRSFMLPACIYNAPTGQRFKEWAIGSADGTKVAAGGSHIFTANTTVYAIWENIPIPPTGTVGSSVSGDATYTGNTYSGTWSGNVLTVQADKGKCTGVWVDNKPLNIGTDCTLTSGSTIVTFSPSFLATLKDGTHTVRVQFTDGRYDGTFTTPLASAITTAAAPNVPATGGMEVSAILCFIAAIGFMALYARKRRCR